MGFDWISLGIAVASLCVGALFKPTVRWTMVFHPSLVAKVVALAVLCGALLLLATLAGRSLPVESNPTIWVVVPFFIGLLVGRISR